METSHHNMHETERDWYKICDTFEIIQKILFCWTWIWWRGRLFRQNYHFAALLFSFSSSRWSTNLQVVHIRLSKIALSGSLMNLESCIYHVELSSLYLYNVSYGNSQWRNQRWSHWKWVLNLLLLLLLLLFTLIIVLLWRYVFFSRYLFHQVCLFVVLILCFISVFVECTQYSIWSKILRNGETQNVCIQFFINVCLCACVCVYVCSRH